MNKLKSRAQYVEEFRKITAIQRLPTLKKGFGDLAFQKKVDNNKFLRLKEEPILTELELNSNNESFCENEYIKGFSKDKATQCRNQISEKMEQVQRDIKQFEYWSMALKEGVRNTGYKFRFKKGIASPPSPITMESKSQQRAFKYLLNNLVVGGTSGKANLDLNSGLEQGVARKGKPGDKEKINQQKLQGKNVESLTISDTVTAVLDMKSLAVQNKKRFDFANLNDYLLERDDLDYEAQENVDLVRKEVELFQQYYDLSTIQNIDQLEINFEQFEYQLGATQERMATEGAKHSAGMSANLNSVPPGQNRWTWTQTTQSADRWEHQPMNSRSFKYLSILGDNEHINYFRDIGPPARNPEQFITNVILKETEMNTPKSTLSGANNLVLRDKIDQYLLQFLEPGELKVDKTALGFADIANVATTRVTSTNAHICIRSEKVTQSQYQHMLRRKERLFRKQNDNSKSHDAQLQTDGSDLHQPMPKSPLGTDNDRHSGANLSTKLSGVGVSYLIEEINSIRRDHFALSSQTNFRLLNEDGFRNEVVQKIFMLLEQLYERAIDGLGLPEDLLEIGFHLDAVEGLADQYCDRKKLIWYVITVLQEIEQGKSYTKTLTNLQNRKRQDEPSLLSFKGDRLLSKTTLAAKSIFQIQLPKDDPQHRPSTKHGNTNRMAKKAQNKTSINRSPLTPKQSQETGSFNPKSKQQTKHPASKSPLSKVPVPKTPVSKPSVSKSPNKIAGGTGGSTSFRKASQSGNDSKFGLKTPPKTIKK